MFLWTSLLCRQRYIVLCLSSDKCTYWKSLWIKVSAHPGYRLVCEPATGCCSLCGGTQSPAGTEYIQQTWRPSGRRWESQNVDMQWYARIAECWYVRIAVFVNIVIAPDRTWCHVLDQSPKVLCYMNWMWMYKVGLLHYGKNHNPDYFGQYLNHDSFWENMMHLLIISSLFNWDKWQWDK